MQIFYKNLK